MVYPNGESRLYPTLPYRQETVTGQELNARIGINKKAEEMAESLSKMSLLAQMDKTTPDQIVVTIPPTRPDVIHKADVVEDVAIAHGYDNITKTLPKTNTTADQVCY